MKQKGNLLEKAVKYTKRYGIKLSAEEMFVHFEQIRQLHADFEAYVKENGYRENLEKMKRNKRLLEKRRLFVQWYFLKNQNEQSVKESFINLSEMIFASTKTVQNDLSKETTA